MKCIFVYCICKMYLHLMSTHSACTMDSSMTQMLYQSMFPDNINLIIVKLYVESIFYPFPIFRGIFMQDHIPQRPDRS